MQQGNIVKQHFTLDCLEEITSAALALSYMIWGYGIVTDWCTSKLLSKCTYNGVKELSEVSIQIYAHHYSHNRTKRFGQEQYAIKYL